MVINGDVISEHVVSDVEGITTQELLEESTKPSPKYYIAAVVNASQYVDGYRMAYILGAEDYTTDAYGHVFYNRQLRDNNFKYFFRVFSISSTQEVQNQLYLYIVLSYICILRMRFQLQQILKVSVLCIFI